MFVNKRLSRLPGVALLCLAFASVSAVAAERHHDHDHDHGHGAAPAVVKPDSGKKWATDVPLREGMENIRQTMDEVHHEIYQNKLSVAVYGELAKRVRGEIEGIIASCKLEPKADAQLHLIIHDVLVDVDAMEGKAKQISRQDGATGVFHALEKYGAHFDHPGWQSP